MSSSLDFPPVIYDRVRLMLPNGQYLANGFVREFHMEYNANNSQQPGMNPTGFPVAQVYGDSVITVSWNEYIGAKGTWFNWTAFLMANPNQLFIAQPFSVNTNAQAAASFTIAGLLIHRQNASFPGNSQAGMRACNFTAATSSKFSY